MGLMTAIAAVGVGLAGVSLWQGNKAAQANAAAQQQQVNAQVTAQKESEALRKQQMDLDATRRRREVLRQSVAARSASLAVTTAQGAAYEGGSAVPGAYGSIAGRTGVNTVGINQNQEIGSSLFNVHQNQLTAYQSAAAAQSKAQSNMAFWQGLGSLGGSLITNAGTIAQVGTYAGGKIGSWMAPKGGFTGWTSYPNG